MTPRLFVQRLSGRLSDGAERGKGFRTHLTETDSSWTTALCGAKPGRRSGSGFILEDDQTVGATCPRCIARHTRLAEKQAAHEAADPHCTCNDCIESFSRRSDLS